MMDVWIVLVFFVLLLCVIGGLVGTIVVQQRSHMTQVQTLVDKIKAPTLESYVQAMAPPPPPRIQVPDGPPDDMGPLQEFSNTVL